MTSNHCAITSVWQKRSASIRTRRVVYVGVDATKHVQLWISSEPTGLGVLQWLAVDLTIAQREMVRRPGKEE